MPSRLNGCRAALDDLLAYLDASPSPWHAADQSARRLAEAGFTEVDEADSWSDVAEAGFVRRGGALVAWRRPATSPSADPCRRRPHRLSRSAHPPASRSAGGDWRQLGRRDLRRRAAQQLARPRPRHRRPGGRCRRHDDTGRRRRAGGAGAAAGDPPRPRRQRAGPGARPPHRPAPGVGRRHGGALRRLARRAGRGDRRCGGVGPRAVRRAAGGGARRRRIAAGQWAPRQPGVVLGGHRRRSPTPRPATTSPSSRCSTTRRSVRSPRAAPAGRSSRRCSNGCWPPAGSASTSGTACSPARAASRPTTPTPCTRTTPSATTRRTHRS